MLVCAFLGFGPLVVLGIDHGLRTRYEYWRDDLNLSRNWGSTTESESCRKSLPELLG